MPIEPKSFDDLRDMADHCLDDPRGTGEYLEWAADEIERLRAALKIATDELERNGRTFILDEIKTALEHNKGHQ